MRAPAAEPPLWRRWATRVYLTFRVSTLGFTLLLPLAGSGSAAAGWRPAQAGWLVAIAMAFHVFAYVLNDVVDLAVDRSEPLRADSPLVRGEIGTTHALVLAWMQPPIAFGVALLSGGDPKMLVWLALAFVTMAAYDFYGKRCRWPLVTDAVQSAGWCALLLMGAWSMAPGPTPVTWWLVGYVFACVMLVNGVHGGLRDLANDQRCGARTTALWLGARTGAGHGVVVSRSLAWYAMALQTALVVCALGAVEVSATDPLRGIAFMLVGLILGAACVSLYAAFRRAQDRPALVSAGAWNIAATLLVLPAVLWPQLGLTGSMVLLAIVVLPVLAMWAYNGSHWHLQPTEGPSR